MRIEKMELMGIIVHKLDDAIAHYSKLFELDFTVLTPGVDYPLVDLSSTANHEQTQIPAYGRIAIDTSNCLELIEMPDLPEGIRNIHFRVDDIEAATEQMVSRGLKVVMNVRAGNVREVIFDSADINNVRVCLVQYEGASFVAALKAPAAAD